jgi:uncharacterized protein (TIGR01777 family)
MVTRHAVVAGSTGFIGAALVKRLRADGWRVTALVRRDPTSADEVQWNPVTSELDPAVLSSADAVINLAGSSISRMPWTEAIKADLMESRRTTTETIVSAINAAKVTPKVFLSASAIGFYGHRGDEELTEKSKRGDGFLADVCVAWEGWASRAKCRTVFLRTGLVLGRGGALAPLKLATLFGAGARVGSGRQWWPWISLRDEVRAIVHLIDSTVSGPVNLVGPTPATANTVTRALATALLRPHLFVIPAFAIKLLGEAGFELLLSSHRLTPEILLADDFRFEHPTASNAVRWAITD